MSEKCPKCGAAYHSGNVTYTHWDCLSSRDEEKGVFHQHDRCRIAELEAENERLRREADGIRHGYRLGQSLHGKATRAMMAEIERLRETIARLRYEKAEHAAEAAERASSLPRCKHGKGACCPECQSENDAERRSGEGATAVKLSIDTGWITPDPADTHRWMIIAYNADMDRVFIFRRATRTSTQPPDVPREAATDEGTTD